MMQMSWFWNSWVVMLALAAVLGCGGPAEKEQEPSASPKKPVNQAEEKPVEPAAPSERPLPAWAKNPPPRGQKPIYGLPLDIQLDTPPVPSEIARPAPPIPKE